MSTKLRKRVMRSEARVAELALQLREERAKLARLQRRFSRAVREDSSSDSSSVDSSPARPTEMAAAPALADTGPEPEAKKEEDQQEQPPPVPLPIADAEQPPAPPPQASAVPAMSRDERKRLILLFADAEGKPTGGGACRRCRLWLQGEPGGPPHLYQPGEGCMAERGRRKLLPDVLAWLAN